MPCKATPIQQEAGFFAGNEVFFYPQNTNAADFVKASVRDCKKYIIDQGYRTIGVGYALAETTDSDVPAGFLNCGPESDAVESLA